MSFLKPDRNNIEKLKFQLAAAFGKQFHVEMDSVVEGFLSIIKERFDIVIMKDGSPLAVLECRSRLESIQVSTHQDWLVERFKKVGVQYGILYFGRKESFYLYSRQKYGLTELTTFDDLISAIKCNHTFGEKPFVDEVAADILSCVPDDLSEVDIDIHSKLDSLFTDDNICFDNENGEVSFLANIEDEFFRLLLPQGKSTYLCRYTTLNSLFLTLKDKTNCMCSLTCMNDKGEISYADKYIHYGVYAYSHQAIDENNDCFILSCCNVDKKDDLTMWRLYGDQGKGVCLEYEIDISQIDNSKFFLAPVSYGTKKNKHPQLDFIQNINHWVKDGWRFRFYRWYIWKHFFKSYLFKDEHEYRLLFIPTENDDQKLRWIMDSTNSIVSRIAIFVMEQDAFPLNLKSVLIGPKCPEQESNVDQLEFMNRKQKVIKPERFTRVVKASIITDFR